MELPETKNLDLEVDRDWLTIWLARPDARNALSTEMVEELRSLLTKVADDRSIRGITIRGRGGTFCSGGDIKGFRAVFQGDAQGIEGVARSSRQAGELFHQVNQMPQVVVMLVEGAAMAGGLGLVCAGDVVIVTQDAKFALTETTLGIPPAQIAPLIVQRLGLKTARRLMLTAARFTGADALGIGLADVVVDDPAGLDAEEAIIKKGVRRCAPGANAVTKEVVLAASHLTRDDMIDLAADRFARCMKSEEGREGVSSFLEKRKPSWAE